MDSRKRLLNLVYYGDDSATEAHRRQVFSVGAEPGTRSADRFFRRRFIEEFHAEAGLLQS